jgi:hypothetical protein
MADVIYSTHPALNYYYSSCRDRYFPQPCTHTSIRITGCKENSRNGSILGQSFLLNSSQFNPISDLLSGARVIRLCKEHTDTIANDHFQNTYVQPRLDFHCAKRTYCKDESNLLAGNRIWQRPLGKRDALEKATKVRSFRLAETDIVLLLRGSGKLARYHAFTQKGRSSRGSSRVLSST